MGFKLSLNVRICICYYNSVLHYIKYHNQIQINKLKKNLNYYLNQGNLYLFL